MATARGFSVDPSGEWSPAQIRHLLEVIGPDAQRMGLRIELIDVTTMGQAVPRFILNFRCRKHDVVVPKDSACPQCLEEF